MECLFCGYDLPAFSPTHFPGGGRLAFDPWLGRLWHVCPSCRRWSAAPFEDRWELIELCEREARRSRVLLTTDQLSLLQLGPTSLIRVGRPPRVEFAAWRYSDLLHATVRYTGLIGRILRLPERTVGGFIGADYHGGVVTIPPSWYGSPFVEHGGLLTQLFATVPFAPSCPSCDQVLVLDPARFADVRFTVHAGEVEAVAMCALCDSEEAMPVVSARPTLRTGLAIITRHRQKAEAVTRAARSIDRAGGARALVERVARRRQPLGALPPTAHLALWIALDELAEAESLESEWRRAEELASIMDGELTCVPGFLEFRERARER